MLNRNDDLPAVENSNGNKDDLLHREGDLPAAECINGDKYYYKDGFHIGTKVYDI